MDLGARYTAASAAYFIFKCYRARQSSESAALLVPNYLKVTKPADLRVPKNQALRLVLATLIWCCLVIAAAKNLQVVRRTCIYIQMKDGDLMIAVDLQGSMKQDDMRHKRRCS